MAEDYEELSPLQAKMSIDIRQVFDAWRVVSTQYRAHYVGGMHWKTVNETEYLVKTINRTGGMKSLGPRSPETEAIIHEFKESKNRTFKRKKTLALRIREMSGVAKAVGINRVPNVVARLLRKLDEQGMIGKNLMVVGTNALFGYEAVAGCFIDGSLTATNDCDLLWDARSTLKLAGNDVRENGLMDILRKVDKSFEPIRKDSYSCINKNGFIVDLIKPTPTPAWKKESSKIGDNDELVAAEIPNLKWLLSSQKLEAMVIGIDGLPALMTMPDPRAFAIYKLWMSRQLDRDPLKKDRDCKQAFALAKMIHNRLPHLSFYDESRKIFPASMQDIILELSDSQAQVKDEGSDDF